MAASDTVVGIVGSVVLVAVMVGVFVYEYNNAPPLEEDDNGGEMEQKLAGESASGAIGPNSPATFRFVMAPDEGVTHVDVSVSWTATAALPVGPAGEYSYSITDGTGTEITSGTTTSDLSYSIEDASYQEYTIVISLPQGSGGGSVDIESSYHYDSASEA